MGPWTNPQENKTRSQSPMTKVDCLRRKLREWLTMPKHSRPRMRNKRNASAPRTTWNQPLMMKSLRTRSVNPTRKPSPRSVTKSSNGLMLTNWLRLMSLQTSKRKWKAFAIQSSLSYTNKQEEHQEVCPVVCQEVCPEACPAVCQEELEVPQAPVVPEDQPSKRSIKKQNVFCPVNYLSNKIHTNSCFRNDVIACC